MQPNSNYFFDVLKSGKASLTDVEANPLPAIHDIKRLLDQIIELFSRGKDYQNVHKAFNIGSLYGKNGDLRHLLKCVGELYKLGANAENITNIDLLIKNVSNTTDCINHIHPLKGEIFMSMILGYAFAILSEKCNIS